MGNWLEKKRYIAIILTILIALEIFLFSSISGGGPSTGGIGGTPWVPTVYHFVVFFLFNFFLFVSIVGEKKIKINHILLVLIISILYAFLDEFHQMFVPFRVATIQDVLINITGIFFSTLVYLKIKASP